jgi:hypothetical protein
LRPDLNEYFRSRWEANYARYLRALGRQYVYEPGQFVVTLPDGTQHAYRPDFLVDGTYYVEIKGYLRRGLGEAAMIAAAQSQLPLPLYLIRESQYRALEAAQADRIPHWERRGDPPPETHEKRSCPRCGVAVTSIHRRVRFCSRRCARRDAADRKRAFP